MNVKRDFLQYAVILLLCKNVLQATGKPNGYNAVSNITDAKKRLPRTSTIGLPTCRINQYFDKDVGRCLTVSGGGKAVQINYTKSCGQHILRPHCSSVNYYYICNENKTILAQCAKGQEFENRLQKCVASSSADLTPQAISPEEEFLHHVQPPSCEKHGRFPVPNHCNLFYTCETNGHRLFQNVYKCPGNSSFHVEKEKCSFDPTQELCLSNVTSTCVPSANADFVHNEGTFNDTGISESSQASTYEKVKGATPSENSEQFIETTTGASSFSATDALLRLEEPTTESPTDRTSKISINRGFATQIPTSTLSPAGISSSTNTYEISTIESNNQESDRGEPTTTESQIHITTLSDIVFRNPISTTPCDIEAATPSLEAKFDKEDKSFTTTEESSTTVVPEAVPRTFNSEAFDSNPTNVLDGSATETITEATVTGRFETNTESIANDAIERNTPAINEASTEPEDRFTNTEPSTDTSSETLNCSFATEESSSNRTCQPTLPSKHSPDDKRNQTAIPRKSVYSKEDEGSARTLLPSAAAIIDIADHIEYRIQYMIQRIAKKILESVSIYYT